MAESWHRPPCQPEASTLGMLSQRPWRGTAVRETRELTRNTCSSGARGTLAKTESGWAQSSRKDGAAFGTPRSASQEQSCVRRASVGACGCEQHMARRRRGKWRTKRGQSSPRKKPGRWGASGAEIGSGSSLLLWATRGHLPSADMPVKWAETTLPTLALVLG